MKRILIFILMFFCMVECIVGVIFIFLQPKEFVNILASITVLFIFVFAFYKLYSYSKQNDYFKKSKIKNKSVNKVHRLEDISIDKDNELYNDIKTIEKHLDSPQSIFDVKTTIEHSLPFDEKYLETTLKDGKTIKEHMQEDYEQALKPKVQETIELNDDETFFVNILMLELSNFKNYEIVYERMSNKCLNFTYDGYQIGRIKLNGKSKWMQILSDDDVYIIDDIDCTKALENINKWKTYMLEIIHNNEI